MQVFCLLERHPGPVFIQLSQHAKDHVKRLDRGPKQADEQQIVAVEGSPDDPAE